VEDLAQEADEEHGKLW